METERSIPELTRDVAHHLGDMFRNELKLARVEATDGVKSMSGGVGLIVAGAVIGVSALTIAMMALVYGLAEFLPMWGAAAAVAGGAALIALAFLLGGKASLKPTDLSLPRTRDQVSRDVQTISEHVH